MSQRVAFVLFCFSCFVFPAQPCFSQSAVDTNERAATTKKPKGKKKAAAAKAATPPVTKYLSFDIATGAGYELRNSGKLEASRDAYEAALTFESSERKRCEVYRVLVSIYPEIGEWQKMYEATEHIIENTPYPAFSSLTLSSMLSTVRRKGKQDELLERYKSKLETNPKDRTALTIMEGAVYTLLHDLPLRAEYLRQMIELDKEEGKEPNTEMMAQLAFTLRLTDKEVESAALYQSIADMDKNMRSYCLAEAAESWERAGQSNKAITAAVEASNLGPDNRANRSLYNWHRLLADLFLKHLAKQPALKHYTAALEAAPIDAYRDQCTEQLRLVNALKD